MQFNDFLCNFPTFYSYILQGKMQREEKQEPVNIMCKAIKKGLKKSLIQAHGNGTCNSRLYEDFFIIFIVEGVKNYPHSIYMNFFPSKAPLECKKSLSLSLSCWAVVAAAAACCCICEKIYKEAKKKSSFSVLYIHRMNSNTTVEKASRRAHTACTWNFRQFIDVCVLAFSALLLLLLVSKCHAHTQTLYFHLFYSLPIQLTKNALGGTH